MDIAINGNPVAIRETLGWSREHLAKASNVPTSAVLLLERLGWSGSPDDNRISAALRIAVIQRLETVTILKQMTSVDVAEDDLLARRVPEQTQSKADLGWNLTCPLPDPSI